MGFYREGPLMRAKPRILAVDDHVVNLDILEFVFEGFGCEVTRAENGLVVELYLKGFMRNFGAGLTSLLCWGCEPTH